MVKVYVAGPYPDRERTILLMRYLETFGIEVTSTWLREAENVGTKEDRQRAADLDIADVERADALLAWTSSAKGTPRGTLIEIGVAIGAKKPVLWVGSYDGDGIFADSSRVEHYDDLESAVRRLRTLEFVPLAR